MNNNSIAIERLVHLINNEVEKMSYKKLVEKDFSKDYKTIREEILKDLLSRLSGET